jgi:flagellar hook-associated protein 3 FlgL
MLMVAAKMDAGDARWLSSDGITATDKAHYQVIEAQTTAAARQNVYDSVSTMLDKQKEVITEDISNASDADVARLAIDLMTMQTIYNMSLSVGSRILPQSLADYL